MNVLALLRAEFIRIDARTRRFVAASLAAHVAILALLTLLSRFGDGRPVITEITWIDPGEPAPALREEVLETVPTPQRQEERHFERDQAVAELTPRPQKPVLDDALRRRLAEATALPDRPKVLSAAGSSLPSLWTPARPAAAPTVGTEPMALRRETGEATAPLALKREAGPALRLALAEVKQSVPLPGQVDRGGDATARRTLAGTLLTGPAADRPVLSHQLPDYPEWAKREGIEASVSLYFQVLPDGRVKESVLVEKTSGFADFDDRTRTALLAWRFEALPRGRAGEQWGTITFHFRLRNGS